MKPGEYAKSQPTVDGRASHTDIEWRPRFNAGKNCASLNDKGLGIYMGKGHFTRLLTLKQSTHRTTHRMRPEVIAGLERRVGVPEEHLEVSLVPLTGLRRWLECCGYDG